MTSTTRTLPVTCDEGTVDVTVTIDDQGAGQDRPRTFLLLHGGGGPRTVAAFAGQLAQERHAKVITPVHPGFGGTRRPDWLVDPAGLARLYARLLDALGADRALVVGNSIGGWIAAELALLGAEQVAGTVLVNAVGIQVPGHPVADISGLNPVELSRLSFHDPSKFRFDPASLTDAQRAAAAADRAALAAYAGHGMTDPTLRERLSKVGGPVLVLWGEGDQVVDIDYGRAFAEAIPAAAFRPLPGTGHLPQVETPEQLLPVLWEFAEAQG